MVGDMTPGELAKADQDVAHTRALIDNLVAEVPGLAGEPFDGRGTLIHVIGEIADTCRTLNGDETGVHALAVELILCLAEARAMNGGTL